MPFYYRLYEEEAAVQKRAADGLLRLREALGQTVPGRTLGSTLLLATWNIREFDSEKFGPRCPECFYYIAEIISHFDLVAVQEVRENLRALDRVQNILGSSWKYVVTDVTRGTRGNGERMAFLHDTRKVTFAGLAGEVVRPPEGRGSTPAWQYARTPFICGFRAGWTKFNLCTVHIYYGQSKPDDPVRVKEIKDLAKELGARAGKPAKQPAHPAGETERGSAGDQENLVLLGDFNIFGRGDVTMKAILDAGFEISPALQEVPGSNVDKSKHYDQIAFRARPERFAPTGKAGVFDYYESVFRGDAEGEYKGLLKGKKTTYKNWRTYQMSDHLVMWVELRIDFGVEYLSGLRSGEGRAPAGRGRGR